jgi:hypothetical protein
MGTPETLTSERTFSTEDTAKRREVGTRARLLFQSAIHTSRSIHSAASLAVLAHQNSSGVRGDLQDLEILQPFERGISCRPDVNSRLSTPQPAEYASVPGRRQPGI